MAGTKDSALAQAIANAKEALELKAAAVEQLGNARELARLLVSNGIGSDEQIAWVQENLPVRPYTRKGGEAETDDEE